MRKKYSTPNLIKAVSLSAAMATLLSSVSPVFAANFAFTGAANFSDSGATVPYTYGSHGSVVLAGDDNYCGADNVVGRGGKQQQSVSDSQRITAEQQYERFVGEKESGGRQPYGTTTEKVTWVSDGVLTNSASYMGTATQGIQSAMPEAFGVYSFATGCGSSATGNYSTAFGAGATAKTGGSQAFGVSALASGKATVAIGIGSEASGESSIAFGGLATASGKDTVALGGEAKAEKEYAIAIGARAEALESGSIAIGGVKSERTEGVDPQRKATAKARNSIAIGSHTYAEMEDSIAIGANAQVTVQDGVAIGGGSLSNRESKTKGYDPLINGWSEDSSKAWISTAGAVSVGEVDKSGNATITRQITGVAAGSQDTDAVNVAQLRAVRDLATGVWKLSANDANPTNVEPGNTVDFSVKNGQDEGKDNLKIEKSNEDNKHKIEFTLNDNLKLTSVTTGMSKMSDDGFIFDGENGPRMTQGGIYAGNQVITGVADATEDDEAVTFKQLNNVKKIAEQGWSLSVNGSNATDVKAGSTVDLIAAKGTDNTQNIKITKSNNNVTFDLAENIKVTSVTTGNSRMSNEGFIFKNGPKMTFHGIDAGDKGIANVADATEDYDAVNYSQMKNYVKKNGGSWKLSVDGNNDTVVNAGNTVDFSVKSENEVGKDNLKIAKNAADSEHNIEFTLNDKLKLTEVTTGQSHMSGDGFFVDSGKNSSSMTVKGFYVNGENTPSMTVEGIDAGNKKIINVADATSDTDAVNYKQLKAVRDAAQTSWMLAVDNGVPRKIGPDSIVHLLPANKEGKENIRITRDSNSDFVEFDLADNINVMTVTAGESIMDAAGFRFENGEGPSITVTGIHAGDKTIKGVAAGVEDTDAVNFGQLQKYVEQNGGSWQLSVDGKNPTDVKAGSTVDFVTAEGDGGHKNITIEKSNENKVTFTLNDKLELTSVTTGNSIMDDSGFGFVDGGPKITVNGIDAGNEKITGVKEGTISQNSRDVINGSQINKISKDIANFFGGNAAFENGKFSGPTYIVSKVSTDGTVEKKEHTNVGSALTELDVSVRNVNKHIEYVDQKFDGKFDKLSQDALLWSETEGAFVALHKTNGEKTESKIKFLADGNISEDSTDAINGSQLFNITQNISNYFGGSTDVLNGIKPAFLIDGTEYNDVTSAFTGVNVSIHKINDKISDLKENSLVKWDEGQQLITIGKDKAGTEINIAGYEKVARKISGVKEAENDDEAVNKAQLDKSIKGISKDALLWDENEEAFVARHEKDGKKTNSKLKYLLDGEIAKGSTDAITGNQLFLMSNKLASYFGGGAKYENDKWTDPTFKIVQINVDGTTAEIKRNNVADAFDEVNKNMTNMNNSIKNVINKVDSDALKWNKDEGAYDAKRNGEPNKIINVADGEIAEGSKDAVNGGQLWKTNERVTKVEEDVNKISNKVDGISNTVNDIGNIVTDVSKKVYNLNNKVNDIAEDAVRYDRDEDGEKTNKITLKGGDPSEPVTIDNVADGKIEKGSKEAINGSQLHDYTKEQMKIVLDESKQYTDQKIHNIRIDAIDEAVDKSKQYTDMKFDALNYTIEGVRKEARQAAAIGLAVSNLRYNDTPGKLSVGFGAGLWRSQSAFAFGAGYTSEKGDIRSNVSVTTSGGHWGVGAGFNMTLN
ncbi:Vomp family autotransporter [Bartonella gabonensis]|uniref:Vomp family autotransporter n=1 Tax=Bartonella gabonensis TaxID=2699889 RepID=UPI00158DDC7B|nr:Vomp family autotransporter [Bartonella gabonensis]